MGNQCCKQEAEEEEEDAYPEHTLAVDMNLGLDNRGMRMEESNTDDGIAKDNHHHAPVEYDHTEPGKPTTAMHPAAAETRSSSHGDNSSKGSDEGEHLDLQPPGYYSDKLLPYDLNITSPEDRRARDVHFYKMKLKEFKERHRSTSGDGTDLGQHADDGQASPDDVVLKMVIETETSRGSQDEPSVHPPDEVGEHLSGDRWDEMLPEPIAETEDTSGLGKHADAAEEVREIIALQKTDDVNEELHRLEKALKEETQMPREDDSGDDERSSGSVDDVEDKHARGDSDLDFENGKQVHRGHVDDNEEQENTDYQGRDQAENRTADQKRDLYKKTSYEVSNTGKAKGVVGEKPLIVSPSTNDRVRGEYFTNDDGEKVLLLRDADRNALGVRQEELGNIRRNEMEMEGDEISGELNSSETSSEDRHAETDEGRSEEGEGEHEDTSDDERQRSTEVMSQTGVRQQESREDGEWGGDSKYGEIQFIQREVGGATGFDDTDKQREKQYIQLGTDDDEPSYTPEKSLESLERGQHGDVQQKPRPVNEHGQQHEEETNEQPLSFADILKRFQKGQTGDGMGEIVTRVNYAGQAKKVVHFNLDQTSEDLAMVVETQVQQEQQQLHEYEAELKEARPSSSEESSQASSDDGERDVLVGNRGMYHAKEDNDEPVEDDFVILSQNRDESDINGHGKSMNLKEDDNVFSDSQSDGDNGERESNDHVDSDAEPHAMGRSSTSSESENGVKENAQEDEKEQDEQYTKLEREQRQEKDKTEQEPDWGEQRQKPKQFHEEQDVHEKDHGEQRLKREIQEEQQDQYRQEEPEQEQYWERHAEQEQTQEQKEEQEEQEQQEEPEELEQQGDRDQKKQEQEQNLEIEVQEQIEQDWQRHAPEQEREREQDWQRQVQEQQRQREHDWQRQAQEQEREQDWQRQVLEHEREREQDWQRQEQDQEHGKQSNHDECIAAVDSVDTNNKAESQNSSSSIQSFIMSVLQDKQNIESKTDLLSQTDDEFEQDPRDTPTEDRATVEADERYHNGLDLLPQSPEQNDKHILFL